jgi:hypothetical protein
MPTTEVPICSEEQFYYRHVDAIVVEFAFNEAPAHWGFGMTKKTPARHKTKKRAKVAHPGMMGDGTEEQNLGERGNPAARIKKNEVTAAFGKRPKK